MPQRYEIVIDPDLKLPSAEIVAAWRANKEATAVGRIREDMTTQSAVFADPAMALLVTTAVSTTASVISGVFTAVLIDYIKAKHYKKKLKTTTVEKPDGTVLLVIKSDE